MINKLITLENLQEFKNKADGAYIQTSNIWTGTKAEWEALDKTTLEDNILINITDDYNSRLTKIDDTLSSDSENPVQNKIIVAEFNSYKDSLDDKADSATTLSGYGITDAKINNNTITLGANTITPLTSHQDISGKADKATTLAGYGITNAYTKTETDTKINAKADKATTLAGYGITDGLKSSDIGSANLIIKQNGSELGSFSANATEDVTINMTTGSSGGGSTINASFPSGYASKTAILSIGTKTYEQTIGTNLIASFLSISEVGTATVTSGDAKGSISVPYYGVYSVSCLAYGYKGWLDKGGVTTSFASLDEVLADQATVRRLMTVHASVDYLYEWYTKDSTILDTVMASTYGAKWLGLRDYACDKFMANSTAKATMLASDNWEYILKDHVPTMTSASAPFGTASASTTTSGYDAYKAFDNNDSTIWFSSALPSTSAYIGYVFTNPMCANHIIVHDNGGASVITVKGSNDGSTWTDIVDVTLTDSKADEAFDNDGYYLYYRIYVKTVKSSINNWSVYTLQFYGRSLNVSVPTMTSNTAPWGTASASSTYSSSYDAYYAFNGSSTSGAWVATTATNQYIEYDFGKEISVKQLVVLPDITDDGTRRAKTCKLQGSNDNSTFTDITSFTCPSSVTTNYIDADNSKSYRYYRLYVADTYSTSMLVAVKLLQFYGTDYSEREFGDSTIKYLYDHGLELETINNYGGTLTKADEYFTISGGRAYVSADTTSYSLARCNLETAVGLTNMYMSIQNSAYSPVGNNAMTVANAPNNEYQDITNINGTYNVTVYDGTSSSNSASITEWWLE